LLGAPGDLRGRLVAAKSFNNGSGCVEHTRPTKRIGSRSFYVVPFVANRFCIVLLCRRTSVLCNEGCTRLEKITLVVKTVFNSARALHQRTDMQNFFLAIVGARLSCCDSFGVVVVE
jgi:hypothetical protein